MRDFVGCVNVGPYGKATVLCCGSDLLGHMLRLRARQFHLRVGVITARRNEAIATGSLGMLGDEQPGAESAWITAGFEWVEMQRVGPKP